MDAQGQSGVALTIRELFRVEELPHCRRRKGDLHGHGQSCPSLISSPLFVATVRADVDEGASMPHDQLQGQLNLTDKPDHEIYAL